MPVYVLNYLFWRDFAECVRNKTASNKDQVWSLALSGDIKTGLKRNITALCTCVNMRTGITLFFYNAEGFNSVDFTHYGELQDFW